MNWTPGREKALRELYRKSHKEPGWARKIAKRISSKYKVDATEKAVYNKASRLGLNKVDWAKQEGRRASTSRRRRSR